MSDDLEKKSELPSFLRSEGKRHGRDFKEEYLRVRGRDLMEHYDGPACQRLFVNVGLFCAVAAAALTIVPELAPRLGLSGEVVLQLSLYAPYRVLFMVMGSGLVVVGLVEVNSAPPPDQGGPEAFSRRLYEIVLGVAAGLFVISLLFPMALWMVG
ncbi:MAG: hypothetical protein V3T02_02530 [Alphaproteobacteria bacterium]